MKKLIFIGLLFGFVSCRESSELDGTYVNQKSDTFTIYHTHDGWFSARLPRTTSSISLKRNKDALESRNANESILVSVMILPDKKLVWESNVFTMVSNKVK